MQSWLKVFNRDSSSTLVEIRRFFPCRGFVGVLMLSVLICFTATLRFSNDISRLEKDCDGMIGM